MRKLAFVPILFFASFLMILYVVIPNYTESSALQDQIEAKERELKEKQDYFANIQKVSDNLVQYEEFLEKIEKSLPQKISLASLLSFFQDRALGSGLVMENLSPKQESKQSSSQSASEAEAQGAAAKIKETGFRLTVSGPFVSFENFLKTIEKSSRLIEVASVAFDEGDGGGAEEGEEDGLTEFEFDLVLEVYSYFDNK